MSTDPIVPTDAKPPLESDLRVRLHATLCHLGISLAIASIAVLLVFIGWYQAPLAAVSGVGPMLMLLVAADVILGPLLTFLVFDRRKKHLSIDLACIAALQVAALAYGLHTIEAGRPHYLVFVKDRFDAVSKADLRPEDYAAASDNKAADPDWFRARVVAAEMPTSDEERTRLLFESVTGGRDLQHFPKQYRVYETQSSIAAGKGMRLDELRALNPGRNPILEVAVKRSGLPEESLRYLPIKGPKGDATMLVNAVSGDVIGMVNLTPWEE